MSLYHIYMYMDFFHEVKRHLIALACPDILYDIVDLKLWIYHHAPLCQVQMTEISYGEMIPYKF